MADPSSSRPPPASSSTSPQTHPHPPESHPLPSTSRRPPFNVGPFPTPPEVMNPALSAGGFSKPPPPGLELPLRWQRGVGVVGAVCTFSTAVWAVLFCDFGTGDRETVVDPIRRGFAPYKAQIFGLSERDKRWLSPTASTPSSQSIARPGAAAEPDGYAARGVGAETDAVERMFGRRLRSEEQAKEEGSARAVEVVKQVPVETAGTPGASAGSSRGCCIM